MKGIVFTEFLEMVEDKFGYSVLDKVIEDSISDGVYTAVGTYSHEEMVSLVVSLSNHSGIDISTLLEAYGVHFFDILLSSYPIFFDKQTSTFSFLSSIDNYIHPEVLKLYPDAELPRFDIVEHTDNSLIMVYYSSRKMSDFAVGLVKGTIKHFGENIIFDVEKLTDDGSKVQFNFSTAS